MTTALDVAKYFLQKVDRDSGDMITQLKLHKLVYYAQSWSIVLRDKPLFSEEVQAWRHGPVILQMRPAFSEYRDSGIPLPEGWSSSFIPDEERILELVWNTYGELSAAKLRRLTHKEVPWLKARKGISDDTNSNNPILVEDMKDYYTNFVELGDNNEPEKIDSRAVLEEKDCEVNDVIPLTDENGQISWAKIDTLKEYFESKGNNRSFIKRHLRRPFAGI